MTKPEGAHRGRDALASFNEPVSTGEIALRRASPSPRVMRVFTLAALIFTAFYTAWFMVAYDQPDVMLAGVSLGVFVALLVGLPLARLQYTTAISIAALTLATVLLFIYTSSLTTASNVHMCLLAVGFAQLALVPEHMHALRSVFSGIVIPLLIASEFLFPPTAPLSASDAARNEILSSVNRIWTVVVVVGAMGIIRYRNSHRQQDLSGAAQLGEYRANTDPLTGLYNRRPVQVKLRELDEGHSHGYAIALVDIDSFKSINDKLGHEEGDALISAIARRLRAHFRQTDVVSRWGGDEFLVLMPSVTHVHLTDVLERLRVSIEESPFSLGAEPIAVTLSIGAARALAGDDSRATINKADQALYLAKKTGRNRVVVAQNSVAEPTM